MFFTCLLVALSRMHPATSKPLKTGLQREKFLEHLNHHRYNTSAALNCVCTSGDDIIVEKIHSKLCYSFFLNWSFHIIRSRCCWLKTTTKGVVENYELVRGWCVFFFLMKKFWWKQVNENFYVKKKNCLNRNIFKKCWDEWRTNSKESL